MDHLDRSRFLHHKRRSECLMASGDGINRASERTFVELTKLPRREWHIIGRTLGSQLIQQPHALLRIGEGAVDLLAPK